MTTDETATDRHPKKCRPRKVELQCKRIATFLGSPPDDVWRSWGKYATKKSAEQAMENLSSQHAAIYKFRIKPTE